MSTLFITGASGFVGGALVRSLSSQHTIRAMSRSALSDRTIEMLGAVPVRCELGAVNSTHLAGCDTVIHCAAFVKQWGSREQYWQANVHGTRQLLAAAKAGGVRRFIHIGTEAVLFNDAHLRAVDETEPYPGHSPFLYSASKALAEQHVLAANHAEFTTLSLRPRLIWGPGDQTILPLLAEMVRKKRFVWIDHGQAQTCTTHIENLAHGVALALTQGQGGNAYFLTDHGVTTFREFLTALLATQKLSPPDSSMPRVLAMALAKAIEAAWRLLRIQSEPPITSLAVSLMSRDCTLKIDKAQRELGYAPVLTREQGLARLPMHPPSPAS
jgi:nucleoside-diphosphate-sugar epimerase